METAIQATKAMGTSGNLKAVNETVNSGSLSDFWQEMESNRFAIVPIVLIIVACIGGIAAAVSIQESALKLAVVALSTALVESFVLAVMPMRTIMISSLIAVALSLLMMVI